MPFTLDIIPHVPSLDMYGSARSGTAYSLSGEIVLTLTSSSSSSSLFGSSASGSASPASGPSSRPTTIYLSSLNVTFEGRTEILSHNCGYAPFRLCQVEKELVSALAADGKPIALSNKGQKNGVMRWKMTFDLAVPGWLPTTSQLDEQGSGTSYALYAHAKFSDDFETALSAVTSVPVTSSPSSSPSANPRSATPTLRPSSPSSRPATPSGMAAYLPTVPGLSGSINLSALNPFSSFSRSKLRNAQATPVSIKVNRFRTPKSLNPFGGAPDFTQPLVPPHIYHPTASLFPVLLESVETRVTMPASGKDTDEGKRIPLDILGGIEVVAGVPEYVGTSEEKIPLSLRVRSTNSDSVNKGLVLEAFDVEVEQMEKFRSVPCERFLSNYPVPPLSQQPPNKPFLTQNPLEGLYSLGLAAANEAVQWTRTVPMLPTKRVNFRPSPATGGLEVDGEWAKMDLAIGVLRKEDMEELGLDSSSADHQDDEKVGRNVRRKILNPDFDTPFVKVRHEMKIALRLSWLPEHAADEIARSCAGVDGEQLRKARMAHPERKTETLLMSLPIKLAAVSQGVERMFKTLGVHYGAPNPISPSVAPSMRRTLAQSRSASPAPSLTTSSSYSSPSSARTSPASGIMALPSVMGLNIPGRSDSPAPSLASSSSHGHSSSSCSTGLHPFAVFPGPFVLPPYSELYHSNGERKEEVDGAFLPAYVEKEPLQDDLDEQDLGLAIQV
ncbi:hypothetical protein FRC04_011656 [Tulasnella sp. 424]|nr:hypothetical protein FRC04_011656 [Tulasnella sp. 424]KAG8971473.1 hypothetical protein FRC05_011046 [Tulasnella sp. 425]